MYKLLLNNIWKSFNSYPRYCIQIKAEKTIKEESGEKGERADNNQLRQNQRQALPVGPSQQIPSIPNDSNQHDNSFEAAEAYNFDSDETSDSGDELVDDELNIPPNNVYSEEMLRNSF
ncbi:hypothetical protein BDC45DRAFT_538174 [Circinella umbellata]|nr:hypothetical protein BDC45DRAFT_538174 [Circinella umbellata]